VKIEIVDCIWRNHDNVRAIGGDGLYLGYFEFFTYYVSFFSLLKGKVWWFSLEFDFCVSLIYVGTPLHHAAKQKNKKAIRFLIENGAFLPPDMLDERFNPPLHYCCGLEWAYKVKERTMRKQSSSERSSSEESSGPPWVSSGQDSNIAFGDCSDSLCHIFGDRWEVFNC
jgi:hypothetical protein